MREPGGHGRVDPARDQRQRAPRRAHRQPAGSGPAVVEEERLAVQDVDLDPQLGRLEVDARARLRRAPGRRAPCEVLRAKRQRLVDAAHAHAEGLEAALLGEAQDERRRWPRASAVRSSRRSRRPPRTPGAIRAATASRGASSGSSTSRRPNRRRARTLPKPASARSRFTRRQSSKRGRLRPLSPISA